MSNLSTEAIVTIISTLPGLLVSALSAWFAYVGLRRRNDARSDIETPTIRVLVRLDAAPRYSLFLFLSYLRYPIFIIYLTFCSYRMDLPRIPDAPQRLHPPPPAEENLPGVFRRPERVWLPQAL